MHPQPIHSPQSHGGTHTALDAQLEILSLFERPAWHAQAACHGVGFQNFFPARGESTNKAKSYCDGCPVRAECLDSALEFRDNGIWAGTSGRERRKIRRLRPRNPQEYTDDELDQPASA